MTEKPKGPRLVVDNEIVDDVLLPRPPSWTKPPPSPEVSQEAFDELLSTTLYLLEVVEKHQHALEKLIEVVEGLEGD